MVIGVLSSGTASNICSCLDYVMSDSIKTLMISARDNVKQFHPFNTVELGSDSYHTGEVISLLLIYYLIYCSGESCPSMSGKVG